MGSVFLPATRCNIILYAVDKQLNKDCRNQGTDKSYPQPEHIFPYTSKPKYKNAQKTHHGSEKGFQFHSTVSGERANLGRWSRLKIVPGEPSLKGPKQQLFKSHPSHLPKVEFLLIRIQLALALVVKGEGHIEHRIAFITPHQNRVLGKAEYYRLAHIFGFQKNRKVTVILRHRKLIRGIVGTQGVASLNVLHSL